MTDPKDTSPAAPESQPEQEGLQQYLNGASSASLPPKSGRRPRYLPPEDSNKKPKFSINIPIPGEAQDSYGQSDMVQNSLFALDGRMGRLSYQAGILVLILAVVIVGMIFSVLFAFSALSLMMLSSGQGLGGGAMLFFMLIFIAFAAGMVLLGVRRLRDMNLSGLWILIPIGMGIIGATLGRSGFSIGPIISSAVSGLFTIGLALIPGTAGDNRFGPVRHTPGIEKVLGWICLFLMVIGTIFNINHRPAHRYTSPYSSADSSITVPGMTADQQARLDEATKKMTPEQRAQFEETMKKLAAMQAEQGAQNPNAVPAAPTATP